MREMLGHQVCETLEEVLDPKRCALLSVDIQNDAMHPDGALRKAGNDISGMEAILPRCADLMAEARELGVPVVHVCTAYAGDGSTDSAPWLRSKGMMVGAHQFFVAGTWGAEICAEVAPRDDELVITKSRSSGFVRTTLERDLRAAGIESLAVMGEQTPGCIDATFRDAAHYDFYNVLVEDCVAAFDPAQHEASLLIQRARHDVCTADVVVDCWRAASPAAGRA